MTTLRQPVPLARSGLALLCLLIVFLAIYRVGWAAAHWDWTYDEPWHLAWSERALLENNFERELPNYISTTPATILNAGARQLAMAAGWQDEATLRAAARMPTVIAFMLLLALTWYSGFRLLNAEAGTLAATLVALDANMLTHAALVTVDTLFAIVTLWLVLRLMGFLQSPSWRQSLLLAVPVGVAFTVKLTAVLFLPVVLLVLLVGLWPRPWKEQAWRLSLYLVSGFGLACLIISAAYRFNAVGFFLGDFAAQSAFVQWLQQALPWLYLPLPQAFLQGFDLTLLYERGMQWNTVIFDRYLSDGVWYYFPVTWLFKTPLAVLALLLLAASHLLHANFRRSGAGVDTTAGEHEEAAYETSASIPGLWVMAVLWAVFFFYFNFVFRTHVGLRYIIMAFPLLYLGAAVALSQQMHRLRSGLLVPGLLLIACAEHIPYWDNALSFSNALIREKKQAYQVLTDSNIDWGQNYSTALTEAWSRYPSAAIYPPHAMPGFTILRLNYLAGVHRNFEQHRWLREHVEPLEHVRHTHLVYELNSDQFENFLNTNNRATPLADTAQCDGYRVASLPAEIPGAAEAQVLCLDRSAIGNATVAIGLTGSSGGIGPFDQGAACNQYSLAMGQQVVYRLPAEISALCLAGGSGEQRWLIDRFQQQ